VHSGCIASEQAQEIEMRAPLRFTTMFVVAAALSAPMIVAAQPATTPPPAAPMPAPIVPLAARPTAAAGAADNSTYVTSGQRVRSSKVVGAAAYNDQSEKIGSVDDVLISPTKEVSGVVLSVGGFLGIASKLVEVPYGEIKVVNDKLVMAGTSKDQLTQIPDYKYISGS
jgi:sporulation protein YlmC with PRC-barrel domain